MSTPEEILATIANKRATMCQAIADAIVAFETDTLLVVGEIKVTNTIDPGTGELSHDVSSKVFISKEDMV